MAHLSFHGTVMQLASPEIGQNVGPSVLTLAKAELKTRLSGEVKFPAISCSLQQPACSGKGTRSQKRAGTMWWKHSSCGFFRGPEGQNTTSHEFCEMLSYCNLDGHRTEPSVLLTS